MSTPAGPVAARRPTRPGSARRTPRRDLVWSVGRRAPLAVALGALALADYGLTPALVLPVYLALVSGDLCARDFAEHRLPNALIAPGYAFAAVQLVWLALAEGSIPWPALAAGAGWFAFFLLLSVAGGMGMGDVKLAGLIGAAAGSASAGAALAAPLLGFLAGGVASLCALLAPGIRMPREIPFGPFLLFGFWAAPSVVEAVAGGLVVAG